MKNVLAFATVLFIGATSAQGALVTIENLTAEITLQPDSTLLVTETLQVYFSERGHGIWRTIPVVLPTPWGARKIHVNLQGVTDQEGNPYETLITREGANLRVRVGSEDVWIPAGERRTYVIRYSVRGAINWFEKGTTSWEPYCELYWNVVGDEWEAPILRASAIVYFPILEKNQRARARVYAGPYGSRSYVQANQPGDQSGDPTLGLWIKLDSDKLSIVRDSPLGLADNLTFVLNLPYDHIQHPPWTETVGLFVMSNFGYTVPLWVLLLMGVAWHLYGRDPKPGPIVVRYEPPDDLTGPEAGTLIDETVHPRDIAAGILSLATKGYVHLHVREEKGLFLKTQVIQLEIRPESNQAPLTEFEALILGYLLNADKEGNFVSQTEAQKALGSQILSLHSALYQSLVQRGYYPRSPESVRAGWIVAGMGSAIALGILTNWLSPLPGNYLPSIIGSLLSTPIILIFGKQMPRRTRKGNQAYAHVLGFAEFIRRAEAPELEYLFKKYPKEAVFEKFIPHACAFGYLKQWVQKFAPLIEHSPSWLHGPSPSQVSLASLWVDFGGIERGLTEMATPPRSSGASGGHSGFGGGGFSGGGFGGGGGGGW
jgi:uncharacterized membrane protein YgcG